MNIFFDVDYTILGLDDSLRPGTQETLKQLKDDGNDIYIWSGMANGGKLSTSTILRLWSAAFTKSPPTTSTNGYRSWESPWNPTSSSTTTPR